MVLFLPGLGLEQVIHLHILFLGSPRLELRVEMSTGGAIGISAR